MTLHSSMSRDVAKCDQETCQHKVVFGVSKDLELLMKPGGVFLLSSVDLNCPIYIHWCKSNFFIPTNKQNVNAGKSKISRA